MKTRFQFSIRTLMLITAIVGMTAVPLIIRSKHLADRRQSISVVEQAGGYVTFNYDSNTPPGPAWVRSLLGQHFFCKVNAVYACDVPLDDRDVASFIRFTDVDEIRIAGTHITDDALTHLSQLKSVRSLMVSDTNISGHGLQYLCSLQNLEHLDLADTRISDDSMRFLTSLRRLQHLSLVNTAISDDGVAHLSTIPLHSLFLTDTRITNTGLGHLSNCRELEILWIDGTSVTDQGMESLKGLKKLETVRMLDTGVSAKAVEQLRMALPNCKVYRTQEEWMGT